MEIWSQWLERAEKRLGKEAVDFWLRSLQVKDFDARNLYLVAQDSFQISWFEEQVADLCREGLKNSSGRPIKVHLLLPSDQESGLASSKSTSEPFKRLPRSRDTVGKGLKRSSSSLGVIKTSVERAPNERSASTEGSSSSLCVPGVPGVPGHRSKKGKEQSKSSAPMEEERIKLKVDLLDAQALFSSYHEHKGNALAFRALKQLSDAPHALLKEPSYNPIYLYGPKGCGKSHLLMALTRSLREQGIRALYSTIGTFTHNVVQAIRKGYMMQFRQMHRNVDVLIFDDLNELAGKHATQEEFFHTFNTMHTQYKQVILASTLAPRELESIQTRLISRFEWGLVAAIAPAPREELLSIARAFISTRCDDKLASETFTHLVEQVGEHIPDLLKAIEKLFFVDPATEKTRLIEHLHQIQERIAPLLSKQKKLTPEEIFFHVANHFGITTKDLLGKSQAREVARARHFAIFICRKNLQLAFTKIGQLFERDHSTIMSGVKKMEQRLEAQDPKTVGDYEALKLKLLAR